MINFTTVAQATQWQALPLCARYLAVVFGDETVQVREGVISHDHNVRWALGALTDGHLEVLGAWWEPKSGASGCQDLFEDLQTRGVEQIRFVTTNGCLQTRAAASVQFPDATVLPSVGQLLRANLGQVAPWHRKLGGDLLGAICEAPTAQAAQTAVADLAASPWGAMYPGVVDRWRNAVEDLRPFYALGPRLRRLVRSGEEAAQRLAGTLQRAVAHKGGFASEVEAIEFTSEALDRVNRGFGTAGPLTGRCVQGQVRGRRAASALARCH